MAKCRRHVLARKKWEIMLERFYPGEYLDSTYEIDFDRLYEEGYRGIIFDIDNTLVPHGAPADKRACAFFAHLKELGYQCMLLSNNKEPRVKMFADAAGVSYIHKAGKPIPAHNTRGHPPDSCEADSSQGRDTDCVKTVS